jgi:hypothetical protein
MNTSSLHHTPNVDSNPSLKGKRQPWQLAHQQQEQHAAQQLWQQQEQQHWQ